MAKMKLVLEFDESLRKGVLTQQELQLVVRSVLAFDEAKVFIHCLMKPRTKEVYAAELKYDNSILSSLEEEALINAVRAIVGIIPPSPPQPESPTIVDFGTLALTNGITLPQTVVDQLVAFDAVAGQGSALIELMLTNPDDPYSSHLSVGSYSAYGFTRLTPSVPSTHTAFILKLALSGNYGGPISAVTISSDTSILITGSGGVTLDLLRSQDIACKVSPTQTGSIFELYVDQAGKLYPSLRYGYETTFLSAATFDSAVLRGAW